MHRIASRFVSAELNILSIYMRIFLSYILFEE